MSKLDKQSFNKIENIIKEYIKKILELDKSKKNLDDKLKQINDLTNNLIDYCIKKKIFYYVENKISYSLIKSNFNNYLSKFIKNLIDPTNSIINKYIMFTNNENNDKVNEQVPQWDNVSDINSLMFKNFKNFNESFDKNVSFDDSIQVNNFDEIEFNVKTLSNIKSNTNETDNDANKTDNDTNNLSLYIKILINQNKYMIEFIDKLIYMCKILSDPDIKYKKANPYE